MDRKLPGALAFPDDVGRRERMTTVSALLDAGAKSAADNRPKTENKKCF